MQVELPKDMEKVNEALDVFVKGNIVYFLHKNHIDIYNLTDKIIFKEKLTKDEVSEIQSIRM